MTTLARSIDLDGRWTHFHLTKYYKIKLNLLQKDLNQKMRLELI